MGGRLRSRWVFRVLVAILLVIVPLSLMGSSAASLGGITSGGLWAGATTQTDYRAASVIWGLTWNDRQWSVSQATVSFLDDDESSTPVSLDAGHRITVVVAYGSNDQTKTCAGSAPTSSGVSSVTVDFSCGGALPASDLRSVSVGIDGTVSILVNSSASAPMASLSAAVATNTGDVQMGSDTSGTAQTLSIAGSPNPDGNPVLIQISSGKTSISKTLSVRPSGSSGAAQSSYTYIAKSSTLSISIARAEIPNEADTVFAIAVAPTQYVAQSGQASSSPYSIGLYSVSVAPSTQSCTIQPSGAPSYQADLPATGTAMIPTSITGHYYDSDGRLSSVAQDVQFGCTKIQYDTPTSLYLAYSLHNATQNDFTDIVMTFDMSEDPIDASVGENIAVSNNSFAPETLSYDSSSRMLTVTYNFRYWNQSGRLQAGGTQDNIQLRISNFAVTSDAGATVTSVQASEISPSYALITLEVAGSSLFPKSWNVPVDMNALVCPVAANDHVQISNGTAVPGGATGRYQIAPSMTDQSLFVHKGQTVIFSNGARSNLQYVSGTTFSSFSKCQ